MSTTAPVAVTATACSSAHTTTLSEPVASSVMAAARRMTVSTVITCAYSRSLAWAMAMYAHSEVTAPPSSSPAHSHAVAVTESPGTSATPATVSTEATTPPPTTIVNAVANASPAA